MEKTPVRAKTLSVLAFVAISSLAVQAAPTRGPLRVCKDNPRYFADATGKALYLTGSHTWTNLQDRGFADTAKFDYGRYLDFLTAHHHNFMRLWAWEQAAWATWTGEKVLFSPTAYARTGPGKALDGSPKFDLTKFNEAYFRRLRARVEAARDRGIYVSVMLFQGFSIGKKRERDPGNPWRGHPFNAKNNINDVNGDLDGDGQGIEIHTLKNPKITRLQEAYVRKVIDTLNDLDNVLFEIANESYGNAVQWQYHMINYIHEYEKTKPYRHPVLMTVPWPGGDNSTLLKSPAEAISPNSKGGYRDNPPPADGRKVIISDTDHLWGIGGTVAWVWKSLCRGLNPIFMDPYEDIHWAKGHYQKKWDPIRKNLGYARRFAERMHLNKAVPRGDLASTKYCLAVPGRSYLVYLPNAGKASVDLSAAPGETAVEWFDPATGKTAGGGKVKGGDRRFFESLFGGGSVLFIQAARGK